MAVPSNPQMAGGVGEFWVINRWLGQQHTVTGWHQLARMVQHSTFTFEQGIKLYLMESVYNWEKIHTQELALNLAKYFALSEAEHSPVAFSQFYSVLHWQKHKLQSLFANALNEITDLSWDNLLKKKSLTSLIRFPLEPRLINERN